MLSKSDVLDAIDLKVDYIGAAASVEEHGITLIPVNKYMLCAEELLDLPQSEWWPFTHCAFEIQKCMNYVSREEAGMTSCDEADSGSDDAMALAGTERDLSTRVREMVRDGDLTGGLAVVCWKHEQIPQLAYDLGWHTSSKKRTKWKADDYDSIIELTYTRWTDGYWRVDGKRKHEDFHDTPPV